MPVRLSNKLSEIAGRPAARPAEGTQTAHFADALALELMRDGENHASYIMHKTLGQSDIWRIMRHMEDWLADAGECLPSGEAVACYIEKYCPAALRTSPGGASTANTGHFLLALLSDPESHAAGQMAMYKFPEDIARGYVADLPAEEDYYAELKRIGQSGIQSEVSGAADGETRSQYGDYGYGEADGESDGIRLWRSADVQGRPDSPLLDKLGADLTRAAAEGEIDSVVGRQDEISRVIQVLCRRKKNNPVLIGEAGVGKSAIVEGLALRIAGGDVPHALRGRTVFSLDVASLVAGTKYRGQFEEKIKAMLDELASRSDVILFIDEIHTIIGAGSTQGSLDVANILKPALARGRIQCIGATTLDEYRESIERDAALERRFQKVMVEPSTPAQTMEILQNIKGYYERHHKVRYTDEAIRACVELTDRYVADRFFPDKAIDALDEAGACARLEDTREPAEMACLEEACRAAAAERVEAVRCQDYPAAAEARIKEAALRSRFAESRAEWERNAAENPAVVTAGSIERVITSMTGIPVEKVSSDERRRLRDMAASLERKVVGQREAVMKTAKSIQRSRAGLKDASKPIGVFMFVGPTGVGKTLLAKELSLALFDRPDALIRIDMSEYSEKHNVSRLIGSPPGYVGYGEGGQLSESVRRHPYSVVLFDEIEKAHPDVFNVMLQIFDDGQLTDGMGRRVDFRNTVIIMTSNVGSMAAARRGRAVGFATSHDGCREEVVRDGHYRRALESAFAPEFINRIDDIVIFNTLSDETIRSIAGNEARDFTSRVEALGYSVYLSPEAIDRLVETGYEPRYGVRSLKRAILVHIEEPLAQMIISGQASPGDTIEITGGPDGIEITSRPSMAARQA